MGGEPGITIVPNLMIAGILTLIVSLAIIVWSMVLVQRRNGGRILILLSVALLLVGGGIGPPLIGILAGVAGIGIGAPLTWWRDRLSDSVRSFLAAVWPWIFAIAVMNGVLLFIGSVVLVYVFDLNSPDLFTNSFFFAVVSLLLTIVTGAAYDVHRIQETHCV